MSLDTMPSIATETAHPDPKITLGGFLQVQPQTSPQRAREIRERLRNSPRAVKDIAIRLKHQEGLTGWQVEKLRLEAKILVLEAEKQAEGTARVAAELRILDLQRVLDSFTVKIGDNSEQGQKVEREDHLPTDLIKHIKRTVAREFNIEVAQLNCDRRSKNYVWPRHVAMYLCKILTARSFPEIGRNFGRDHTTIMSCIKRMPGKMAKYPEYADKVALIKETIERDLRYWRCGGELKYTKPTHNVIEIE